MSSGGYDELFFAGGGFRVLPFLGALVDVRLECVGAFTGLSSGSLLAFLLVLGYTPSEIAALALREEWSRAFRSSCSFERLLRSGGALVEESPVRLLVVEALRGRNLPGSLSLGDLLRVTGRRLRVVVANAGAVRLEALTPERHGAVPVVEALLASTAVPFIFPEVSLPRSAGVGGVFFDGGVLNNAPVHLRCGPRTLALLLLHAPVTYSLEDAPWRAQARFCTSLALTALQAASVARCDGACDLAFMPRLPGVRPLQRLETSQAARCLLLGLLAWRLRPHLPCLLVGLVLTWSRVTSTYSGASSPGGRPPSGLSAR
jgi:hypothetical protein